MSSLDPIVRNIPASVLVGSVVDASVAAGNDKAITAALVNAIIELNERLSKVESKK